MSPPIEDNFTRTLKKIAPPVPIPPFPIHAPADYKPLTKIRHYRYEQYDVDTSSSPVTLDAVFSFHNTGITFDRYYRLTGSGIAIGLISDVPFHTLNLELINKRSGIKLDAVFPLKHQQPLYIYLDSAFQGLRTRFEFNKIVFHPKGDKPLNRIWVRLFEKAI